MNLWCSKTPRTNQNVGETADCYAVVTLNVHRLPVVISYLKNHMVLPYDVEQTRLCCAEVTLKLSSVI